MKNAQNNADIIRTMEGITLYNFHKKWQKRIDSPICIKQAAEPANTEDWR